MVDSTSLNTLKELLISTLEDLLKLKVNVSETKTQFQKLIAIISQEKPDQSTVNSSLETFKKWLKQTFSSRPDVLPSLQPLALFLRSLEKGNDDSKTLVCPEKLRPSINFDDLSGLEREKREIYDSFVQPATYPSLFRRPPSGLLLYGTGGVGKTELVKAAVGSVPNSVFFNVKPSSVKGSFHSETEKNITNIFKCAKNALKEPNVKISVLFFDELSELFSSRTGNDPNAKLAVVPFLTEFGGVEPLPPGLFVIGACNSPNAIDSSVYRRFSSHIFVDLPIFSARKSICRDRLLSALRYPNEIKKGETKIKGIEVNDNVLWERLIENNPLDWVAQQGQDPSAEIDAFLDDFAEKTGPSPEAANNVDMFRKKPNETFSKKAKSTYGYSGSDIDKVVEKALFKASVRCLSIYVTKNHNDVEIEISPEFEEKDGYLVYVSPHEKEEEENSTVRYSLQEVKHRKMENKVVNFYIEKEDFDAALDEYGSTVKNDEYDFILRFARGKALE